MACVVCGENRRSKGSLFEIAPEMDSVGVLCRKCYRGLKKNRPDSMGCGFKPEKNPCQNEARFGTGELERHRAPSSPEPTDSTRVVDELLLCEDHYKSVQNGEYPEWL